MPLMLWELHLRYYQHLGRRLVWHLSFSGLLKSYDTTIESCVYNLLLFQETDRATNFVNNLFASGGSSHNPDEPHVMWEAFVCLLDFVVFNVQWTLCCGNIMLDIYAPHFGRLNLMDLLYEHLWCMDDENCVTAWELVMCEYIYEYCGFKFVYLNGKQVNLSSWKQ